MPSNICVLGRVLGRWFWSFEGRIVLKMIISKEKESHSKYNPQLDNANRDVLFKDKIDRVKHFLTEKGMLVASENKETKNASV
jgi:hypothetical protein